MTNIATQTNRPHSIAQRVLKRAFDAPVGSITIVTPEGTEYRIDGRDPGPEAVLQINSYKLFRRIVTAGALGFCEGYLAREWTSPDPAAVFMWSLRNEQSFGRLIYGKWWLRLFLQLRRVLQRNTKSGSSKNIAEHYDLGNDFYAKWLDPSMTYSSGVFLSAEDDLTTAQRRKFQALADKLALTPEHHLLDIGCGWGGFAEFAARDIGCRVTATTISRAQFEFAKERIVARGLENQVALKMCDYRELNGAYDRVSVIEMFEAVGEAFWPVFFSTLRRCLKPGGVAALQVITIADEYFDTYRRSADYIQRYVFPGGMLPSMPALRGEIDRADLTWVSCQTYGASYAQTLAEWQTRFQAAWSTIAELGFDDYFKRLWEQYLYYCEAGFRVGTIDVAQVVVGRDRL